MSARPILEPDSAQIAAFVDALFRYADEGTYVSLRAFDQFDSTKPPVLIRSVPINGAGLNGVIQQATAAARHAANTPDPAVFAPIIAAFGVRDRARECDLANGLAISVEVDDGNSEKARKRLEGLLGPATVIVASGGDWSDPDTGELCPKLHLHWRLSEPTRDAESHAKLKHARRLAGILGGGDPTAKPAVHPLRWPGSWHLKGRPKLAQIVALNESAQVHLTEAADTLEAAAEAEGLRHVAGMPVSSGNPQAPLDRIQSALAAIPNNDVHYDEWIRMGYAVHAATGGSTDGFEAWSAWSSKSAKHHDGETLAAWGRIASAKPTKIGAGSIFFQAKASGWKPDRPGEAAANANAGNASGPSYPEPDLSILRLNRRAPPALPLDVFGPHWSRWLAGAAKASSAPADYVAAPLLSASSALIGNARWAKASDGWAEPPHLWCCGVGDSGDGKSPGADCIIRDMIPDLERALIAESGYQSRMSGYRLAAEVAEAAEELWKKDVREAKKKGHPAPEPPADMNPGDEPKEPCLKMHDVTIEEVAHQLAHGSPKGLLMIRDELSGWFLGMAAYNEGARQFWLETYGGRPYRIGRRKHKNPINIPHLAVAWFGGIQPDKLAEAMLKADDGLLGRFLLFWPDPVRFDFAETAPDTAWATKALHNLRRLQMIGAAEQCENPTPVYVPLSPAAKLLMGEFAREMQQQKETAAGLLRSAYGKARGMALRLALVLEYLWWAAEDASWSWNGVSQEGPPPEPTEISEKAFSAAAGFVAQYAIPMAARAYGDAQASQEDKDAAMLARWIVKERATEVHVRHMQRIVRLAGLTEADPLHRAARRLIDAGILLPIPPGGFRQRAKQAYPVNPRLMDAIDRGDWQ